VIVRDRDFALCIAHEEEGQGPSLERLILDRSFKEAASLLEPGVSIPVAILPTDAAPWLAAWLDKRGLQLDRDGDDWFVTKRGERGSDLAARLGVAIHVVLPPLLFAIFALLALLSNACTPLPNGRRVDATAAMTKIIEIYTGRQPSPPELVPVYVVPADCEFKGYPGFMDEGACRGGMTLDHDAIYVVEADNFGDHLPHEVMHLLGKDHPGLPNWPAGSREDQQVVTAMRWLWANPAVGQIAK